MSFGKNLALFRKEKGLTQEELVQRSGVAISQIRRYEADKASPTLEALTKLAKALGASLDALAFDQPTGVAASKILDRELLEQFALVAQLAEEDRAAVKTLLEGVIVKHQVEKLLRPKPDRSWGLRFREITTKLARGAQEYSQAEIEKTIDAAVTAVRAKKHART